ncbi:MAG: hypothetical protein R3F20_02230 [Planctomycetota bacterium]
MQRNIKILLREPPPSELFGIPAEATATGPSGFTLLPVGGWMDEYFEPWEDVLTSSDHDPEPELLRITSPYFEPREVVARRTFWVDAPPRVGAVFDRDLKEPVVDGDQVVVMRRDPALGPVEPARWTIRGDREGIEWGWGHPSDVLRPGIAHRVVLENVPGVAVEIPPLGPGESASFGYPSGRLIGCETSVPEFAGELVRLVDEFGGTACVRRVRESGRVTLLAPWEGDYLAVASIERDGRRCVLAEPIQVRAGATEPIRWAGVSTLTLRVKGDVPTLSSRFAAYLGGDICHVGGARESPRVEVATRLTWSADGLKVSCTTGSVLSGTVILHDPKDAKAHDWLHFEATFDGRDMIIDL